MEQESEVAKKFDPKIKRDVEFSAAAAPLSSTQNIISREISYDLDKDGESNDENMEVNHENT